MNVEIEIEHADEVFLEFAAIDYLYRPEMNFRFGMVLMPVGFVNEIHEPPYYYGNQRPVVEQTIIPTTWRGKRRRLFRRVCRRCRAIPSLHHDQPERREQQNLL